ncbi:MAG: glycoside hydrolase family 78 protein [Bacillus sp. (in: Bacteria)]|nr:glycoside hydrolase family 78 protein [Bacillus sp. (in: firmicutes)]MCM1426397.1 glycoside hydrolase family 78 protein [Eubacterium sp.]
MKIEHLRVNHLKNPLGYDFSYLTFSWKVKESVSHFCEETQLLISESEDMKPLIYDSGVMKNFRQCSLTVQIPLKSRTRYFWKVITRTALKTPQPESAESETAWFETAKIEETWNAEWISVPEDRTRMPVLYRDFSVENNLKNARLYIFGAGLYEVMVNEIKAGNEYLLPGYHSYDLLMEYQTFDIMKYIKTGNNRISVLLGEGWYKGRFGFDDEYFDLYGDRKKCIAEVCLEYESGQTEWIYTDENWKAETSPILGNGIYDGEWQDDTKETLPLSVTVLVDDKSLLTPRTNPPIHKMEEFAPVSETFHKDGYLLLDFGESITGWVEFSGEFENGQQIRLQYGEILQSGEFYRDNLRTAKAEFVYTAGGADKSGKSRKIVRPHFTYYGFRYVKVEGIKKEQKPLFRAYRLMSDIEATGKIVTSNAKVNTLFDNTVRSQKCNFLDMPTDCPQRDERMGWTGDANIFAHTACFHMDSSAFFRHYTKSLYQEQKLLNGAVPFFAPRPKVPVKDNTNPFYLDGGACIWGDVAAMLPWTLYRYYGDEALLKEQYPMMKAWVEYIRESVKENDVPNLWQNGRHLGDWLALDNGNIHNPIGKTDSHFLASACYYYSTHLLANAGEALGLAEKDEYRQLAKEIKQAFIGFYFTADGRLKIETTQTACAFLLYVGLYPDENHAKEKLAEELKRLISENGGHLNTGFAGTPVLCPALSESGLHTLAYDLLLNEEYPGWLYEVNLGATTVWERWNSLDENGMISDTGMNSLNHYAYGSIADWMYRYMCGFMPSMNEEVKMTIKPMPDKRFSFVKGKWESVFGTYISDWTYDEKNGFQYYMEIPFNANAKAVFPNGKSYLLERGTYHFNNNGDYL